jgi:DNA-binding NtrC family response regulator
MPPIEQSRNTSKPLHLLIIEDCDDEAQLLVSLLSEGGYAVVSKRVETAEAMHAALDRGPWDIVISDYSGRMRRTSRSSWSPAPSARKWPPAS